MNKNEKQWFDLIERLVMTLEDNIDRHKGTKDYFRTLCCNSPIRSNRCLNCGMEYPPAKNVVPYKLR